MKSCCNIDKFLTSKNIAIAGVSTSGKKFGNTVFKLMKKNGYKLYIIHPFTNSIDNEPCFKNITEIKYKIDGFLCVLPQKDVYFSVKQAVEAGIENIWIQQGSETKETLEYLSDKNINVITGKCIIMYLPKKEFPHRIHAGLWKFFGLYNN